MPGNFLHFGNTCQNGAPAITWTFTATAPNVDGGNGLIAGFQIIPSTALTFDSTTKNPSGADNLFPYASPAPISTSWVAIDAPAIGLDGYSSASAEYHFNDYFLYLPNDPNGNVWVTLGTLDWNWSASTTLVNNAWSSPTVTSLSTPPAATSSTTGLPPTWSGVFQNTSGSISYLGHQNVKSIRVPKRNR